MKDLLNGTVTAVIVLVILFAVGAIFMAVETALASIGTFGWICIIGAIAYFIFRDQI